MRLIGWEAILAPNPALCMHTANPRVFTRRDGIASFYKLAQAASSSGVGQSLARDDSAASAGSAVSAFTSLSVCVRGTAGLTRAAVGAIGFGLPRLWV